MDRINIQLLIRLRIGVLDMRMRKKQWAEPFLEENSDFVLKNPASLKGNWKNALECNELHVEIGSGKGDYLFKMAEMDRTVGWVGIEKEHNVAAVAVKKILEKEHDNILFIAQDATQFEEWFNEGEIDVIHLNFSDPWPKSGYKKRRLSHRGFLEKYAKALSSHGKVIMKTDNSTLFEFSLVEFAQCDWQLEDVSVDFRRKEHPEDAITEYEQRFMDLKQPIYRAIWRKKQ